MEGLGEEGPLWHGYQHSILEFALPPRWVKWFIDCQFVKCSLGISGWLIVGPETYFIAFSVKIRLTCAIYHLSARVDEIPVAHHVAAPPESPGSIVTASGALITSSTIFLL